MAAANARMLHIFEKLGFKYRGDVCFFPTGAGLQKAINSSSVTAGDEDETDGGCFLEKLGIDRQTLRQWLVEGERVWQVCRDASEVEEVMRRVEEEARGRGVDVAAGFACAEYRVYSARQKEIVSAVADGALLCMLDCLRVCGREHIRVRCLY